MPCRYEESPQETEKNRLVQQNAKDRLDFRRVIDNLESLLCASSRVLERYEYDFAENPELDSWWTAHRKKDEKRQKKELKEAAIAKREIWVREQALTLMDKPLSQMSDEERKILKEAEIL